jgi:hypothetical protein
MNAPETRRAVQSPLVGLLDLAKRARQATSTEALRFLLVNDTRALLPYRQAALWSQQRGVEALSGVLQVEANAPYVQWLNQVMKHCRATMPQHGPVNRAQLPEEIVEAWSDWLPAEAYWLPAGDGMGPSGGFLLARDQAWTAPEGALLAEWLEHWQMAWRVMHQPSDGRTLLGAIWGRRSAGLSLAAAAQPFWRRRWVWWLGALALVGAVPVPLTVLAPAELVPARPYVVRAPLDGVIDAVLVQPNESVRAGQALFQFDEALLRSRLDVARQALATAEVEYRQVAQQAFQDPRAKALLATLAGKIEERRTEVAFVEGQASRARVLSPHDGVALIDDPTQWIGRPVTIGEAVLRVAELDDVEVEAWIGVSDAIPLEQGAPVTLHLNASPLAPVRARIRYLAHGPVERPDGSYAYRMRASIESDTVHRVGLKGTARVSGDQVPLAYWVVRRPWALARAWLGW